MVVNVLVASPLEAEHIALLGALDPRLAITYRPDLVGEPPMAFLTGWRLALAADLLLEPGSTVGAVARRVGYSSPFTFSTAFKRVYGVSPKAHRDATRDVVDSSTAAAMS